MNLLKKGDSVVMHTCGEAEHYDGKLWICTTDEQKLHEEHNHTVVWLEGFSGCFATKYLQKVNVDLSMIYLVTNGNFLEGYYKNKEKAKKAVVDNNNAAKEMVARGIKQVDTKPCYIEEIQLAD